jgi:23S rRNA (cytidine2498-2'-O)-methyltransferase
MHKTILQADPDYVSQALYEAGACKDDLIGAHLIGLDHQMPDHLIWPRNVWRGVRRISIKSISDAVHQLTDIQRNWVLYSTHHHRRAQLIADQLPYISGNRHDFSKSLPSSPLGHWTMIDRDTILAAPNTDEPFPKGQWEFVEDKQNPPNRAYLKIWEALYRFGKMPDDDDRVLDLGAAPGGWTWAMAELGVGVLAVDKADLDPSIAGMNHVSVRQESAFALSPSEFDDITWLISDIACYPDRLLELVRHWINKSKVEHMICTIKLQGDSDHDMIQKFAAIPNSWVKHLYHNKHEVTWFWSRKQRVG